MRIRIIICVIFEALFFFASGQLSPTKPFHLTDGHNGVKCITFRAPEQCLANAKATAKNHGIEFRLPKEGGNCDEGLLICYQHALLQRNSGSFNFKFKRTFTFGEPNNDNSVANECAEMFSNYSISDCRWHGFKLYTKPTTKGHEIQSSRDTILEATITSRSYNLGDNRRQFTMNFGGIQNGIPFTWITSAENEKPLFPEDSAMRNESIKNVQNGAFLGEHAGLWLIGMDMLPMMGQQQMKLYINRGCLCAMQAWFIQPTDSNDPITPKTPTVGGSKSCPTLSTNRNFSANFTNEEQKITIKALTDPNFKDIEVELVSNKTGKTVMSLRIGSDNGLDVSLPGHIAISSKGTRLPSGSYTLKMDIVLHKHCCVILLNDTQLGSSNLEGKWWDKMSWNDITQIKLHGQVMLFEDPIVRPIKEPLPCPPLLTNNTFPIKLTSDEQTITVKALTDANIKSITVEILSTEYVSVGKSIMGFTIGTDSDFKVYWPGLNSEFNSSARMAKGGNRMHLDIVLYKYCCMISLNDNQLGEMILPTEWLNKMPSMKDITMIKVQGQMQILENPFMEQINVSVSCPALLTDKTFPIEFANQKQTMHIKALTDPNIKHISVELLSTKKAEPGEALMSFTLGTDNDFEVLWPGLPSKFSNNSARLQSGNYKLDLAIVLYKYCCLVSLNGKKFGEMILPTEWLNEMPLKDITLVKVHGQMQLLQDPVMEQIKVPMPCPPLMTNQTFPITFTNEEQIIAIKAVTDQNVENILVELLSDASGLAAASFNIGTRNDFEVTLPWWQSMVSNGTRLANGSYKLSMELVLMKHCCTIRMKGTQLGTLPLPKEWWDEMTWKDIKQIKMEGQMQIVEKPVVKQILNGSVSCPPLLTNRTFPIKLTNENQSIFIKALTDPGQGSNDSIRLELLSTKHDPSGQMAVLITIGTDEDLQIFLSEKRKNSTKGMRLPRGSERVELEIMLHKHAYQVKLDGTQLSERIEPEDWWNELPWADITLIKVLGKMQLHEDIIVKPTRKNQFPRPAPEMLLPFNGTFEQFWIESYFIFRVQMFNASVGHFKVIFSNVEQFSEAYNHTAFVIQFDGTENVSLSVYHHGRWHPEEAEQEQLLHKGGIEFKIEIRKIDYVITINGRDMFYKYSNTMPHCDITFVRAVGAAVLLTDPILKIGMPEVIYLLFGESKLDNILNYGDRIVVNGSMLPPNTEVEITLWHNVPTYDPPDCSKKYDIVLRTELKIGDYSQLMQCMYQLHEEEQMFSVPGQTEVGPMANQKWSVEIMPTPDGFFARWSRKDNLYWDKWIPICPFRKPDVDITTMPIPPWIINHVQIVAGKNDIDAGGVFNVTVENGKEDDWYQGRNEPIPWKRLKFTQIAVSEKENRPKIIPSVVIVTIHLNERIDISAKVRVNFFYQALEFNDKYGMTIMCLEMRNNTLTFNSYMRRKWSEPTENNEFTYMLNYVKEIKKKITLIIQVEVNEFIVTLNAKGTDDNGKQLRYPVKVLSVNEIEYITVEHDNIKLVQGTEPAVTCEPPDACIKKT